MVNIYWHSHLAAHSACQDERSTVVRKQVQEALLNPVRYRQEASSLSVPKPKERRDVSRSGL